MLVAVIDSGVQLEKCLYLKTLQFDLEIISGKIQKRKNYGTIHGTLVSDLIKANCPDAEIGSIKIIGTNNNCPNEYVLTALKWCVDNNIKWIHMSIGTTNWKFVERFEAIIRNSKDVVFVAARDNEGNVTFPADIPGVCAIERLWSTTKHKNFFERKELGGYRLLTNYREPELLSKYYDSTTFYSNSYQAAITSGKLLYKYLNGKNLLDDEFVPVNLMEENKNNKLEIPVIAISGALNSAKELIRYFVTKDYCAVMLYCGKKEETHFLFRTVDKITLKEIKNYIRQVLCDILFVYIGNEFNDNYQFNFDYSIDINSESDIDAIYRNIIRHFSCEN